MAGACAAGAGAWEALSGKARNEAARRAAASYLLRLGQGRDAELLDQLLQPPCRQAQ
jgi:hypothetical protein